MQGLRLTCIALCFAWHGIAVAQDRFMFAGLPWGTTISEVEQSLQKQGFSGFSTYDKLSCKLKARPD